MFQLPKKAIEVFCGHLNHFEIEELIDMKEIDMFIFLFIAVQTYSWKKFVCLITEMFTEKYSWWDNYKYNNKSKWVNCGWIFIPKMTKDFH